jgi:hypothetical protein
MKKKTGQDDVSPAHAKGTSSKTEQGLNVFLRSSQTPVICAG